jgi:hypothetical protein
MCKFKVCPVCDGEGKRAPEAFRGVLDQDTVDDEEFMEIFLAGGYDVTCECCKGNRVVTDEEISQWESKEDARAEQDCEHKMLHGLDR